MFVFSLLSKLFNKVSPSRVGSATKPCLLITESAMRPPVFHCCQLPYHLVQKCLCRSADRPGTLNSHWNSHSTLRPFEIHDVFTSPYRHPNHKSRLTRTRCPSPPWLARVQGSRGRGGFRQKPSRSLRQGLRKLFLFPGCCPQSTSGRCSVQGGVSSDITMPVHLTDTCRWRLYDSFDAHSQLQINNTYHCYQALMHRLSILQSYQSVSLGATRSVTNTMLVRDTGASIGLTPFQSDVIDYLSLDGVTVKDIAWANSILGIGTIMWKLLRQRDIPSSSPRWLTTCLIATFVSSAPSPTLTSMGEMQGLLLALLRCISLTPMWSTYLSIPQ
jgi:hypothetical protein